ncbi:MAG: tyrosine-type recombinase/integrase [Anaerolineales bacterium]|jgi:integrase/recombinase XerD
MSSEVKTTQKWSLTSFALRDAFTDFVLSRQAMRCSPKTLDTYGYTVGGFVTWLEGQSITIPAEVTARHVRAFLAEKIAKGNSSWTVNDFARGIRTLLRFWHAEGYSPEPVLFAMPKVDKKRLPVLSAEDVSRVLAVCKVREKAIILLMVDTGLRRSEVVALNWGDLDFNTGLLRVALGKGGKCRAVVAGATTRRALLAYRRTLATVTDISPLIQSFGHRLAAAGLLQVCRRLSNKSGIRFTPHALRRTFCILSLRAGMSVLHVQALGGWASLEMVKHYAQMTDEDLISASQQFSPCDNLSRLK